MSWVTLMAPTMGAHGLGSAQAGARWGWAEARANALPVAPTSQRAAHQSAAHALATIGPAPMTTRAPAVRTSERAHEAHEAPPVQRLAEAEPAVARSIAEAALLLGREADDIWAEAAREWLGRHLGLVAIVVDDANDDPPPTAPAAAQAARRASRCWAAIDALLDDLRAPAA